MVKVKGALAQVEMVLVAATETGTETGIVVGKLMFCASASRYLFGDWH